LLHPDNNRNAIAARISCFMRFVKKIVISNENIEIIDLH
jgi:hypothetical protein